MPYKSLTGLSRQLWWQFGHPICTQITRTPLVTGLIAGLPAAKFHHFTVQDTYYLEQSFQPAMHRLQQKACTPRHQTLFTEVIESTEAELRVLRAQLKEANPSESIGPSPVCANYGQHLIKTIEDHSYTVGVAACLPCFMFFPFIGAHIKRQVTSLDSHPQEDWIRFYADGLFPVVHSMTQLMNEVSAQATNDEKKDIRRVFTTSAHHELHFFNDALPEEEPTYRPGW